MGAGAYAFANVAEEVMRAHGAPRFLRSASSTSQSDFSKRNREFKMYLAERRSPPPTPYNDQMWAERSFDGMSPMMTSSMTSNIDYLDDGSCQRQCRWRRSNGPSKHDEKGTKKKDEEVVANQLDRAEADEEHERSHNDWRLERPMVAPSIEGGRSLTFPPAESPPMSPDPAAAAVSQVAGAAAADGLLEHEADEGKAVVDAEDALRREARDGVGGQVRYGEF